MLEHNEDFIDFWSKAMEVSEKYHASVEGEGAQVFVENLYEKYQKKSSTKDKNQWLTENLKDKFIYMNVPPEWIHEPHWAYFQNEPMVFLYQFKIWTKDRKFIKKFPIGDTAYVFGSKSPVNPSNGESWIVIYRTVITDENGYLTDDGQN